MKTWSKLRAAARKEEGQTMAEYAVVLAIITATGVAAFTLLGGAITGLMNDIVAIF